MTADEDRGEHGARVGGHEGPDGDRDTSSGRKTAKAAREERLKARLRENLKRRKAQQRGRSPASGPDGQGGE